MDYSQEYFTIESLESGNTITLTIGAGVTTSDVAWIAWSKDKENWHQTTNLSGSTITTNVNADANEKIYFKGSGANLANNYETNGNQYRTTFSSTKNYSISGNIMSLLYSDSFYDKTSVSGTYAFCGLFYQSTKLVDAQNFVIPIKTIDKLRTFVGTFRGCTSLVNTPKFAPESITAQHGCLRMFWDCSSLISTNDLSKLSILIGASACMEMFRGCTSLVNVTELPATTLSSYCYSGMFRECTSLAKAPVLPATTLASYCYQNMFYGCTSLTQAPNELPATTLYEFCYDSMFQGCTSLKKAPILPSSTVPGHSYEEMFYGCTNLQEVTCLATDISATNCVKNWLYNVSASGTFYKDASMSSFPSGASGIPTNWTVETANTFTYNGHYPDNITLNGTSLSYLKVNGSQVWRKIN